MVVDCDLLTLVLTYNIELRKSGFHAYTLSASIRYSPFYVMTLLYGAISGPGQVTTPLTMQTHWYSCSLSGSALVDFNVHLSLKFV